MIYNLMIIVICLGMGILWYLYQVATIVHCYMYLKGVNEQQPAVPQHHVVPMGPGGSYGYSNQMQVYPPGQGYGQNKEEIRA